MKVLFFILITLTLTLSKSELVCPDDTACPSTGYTCCLKEYGWYGCCPLDNAVCCSDLIHCCPANTLCNLIDSTCDKKSFLNVEYYTLQKLTNSIPMVKPAAAKKIIKDPVTDSFIVIINFLKALKFEQLPNILNVNMLGYNLIKGKVDMVIQDLKKFDYTAAFHDLTFLAEAIQKIINEDRIAMKDEKTKQEMKVISDYIQYFKSNKKEFLKVAMTNLFKRFDEAMGKMKEIERRFRDKDFENLGILLAEFLLWIFTNH